MLKCQTIVGILTQWAQYSSCSAELSMEKFYTSGSEFWKLSSRNCHALFINLTKLLLQIPLTYLRSALISSDLQHRYWGVILLINYLSPFSTQPCQLIALFSIKVFSNIITWHMSIRPAAVAVYSQFRVVAFVIDSNSGNNTIEWYLIIVHCVVEHSDNQRR